MTVSMGRLAESSTSHYKNAWASGHLIVNVGKPIHTPVSLWNINPPSSTVLTIK